MAIKPSGLLDVHHVANLLACTEKRVRDLIRNGKLEAYRIGKREYRISRESALKFLEEQKEDPNGRFN